MDKVLEQTFSVILRAGRTDDALPCGTILYQGFRAIAEQHGLAPDFPCAEFGAAMLTEILADPAVYSVVAEASDGRVSGYASEIGFFGHAVGENNEDFKALIGAAPASAELGFYVPMRNADLFRWCLNHGLRVTQTATLMSLGLYNEPAGVFLPSVLY